MVTIGLLQRSSHPIQHNTNITHARARARAHRHIMKCEYLAPSHKQCDARCERTAHRNAHTHTPQSTKAILRQHHSIEPVSSRTLIGLTTAHGERLLLLSHRSHTAYTSRTSFGMSLTCLCRRSPRYRGVRISAQFLLPHNNCLGTEDPAH